MNYDKIAEDYPHDAFYIKYVDEYTFFHLLGDITDMSILDIGCGRGEHSRLFKEKGAARVVGVDYSAEMLKFAQIAESRSPLGIEYRQIDMFVPQKIADFDLVVAFSVLSLAPTREKLLNACQTIIMNLKPGGRFITVGLNPEQDPETYPLSEKYGFKIWSSAPVEEGAVIRSSIPVDEQEIFFEDYYFTQATYEWALQTAGFQEIRWHDPVVSPEGLEIFGQAFWQDFINYRMSIYLECVK